MITLTHINSIAIFIIVCFLLLKHFGKNLTIALERTLEKNRPIGIEFWWWHTPYSGTRIFYIPFWKESWIDDKIKEKK